VRGVAAPLLAGGGGGGGGGAETMNAPIGFSITSGFSLTYRPAATIAPMRMTWITPEISAVTQPPFFLSVPADSMRTSSNIACPADGLCR
jgi:hypothetical protein